MSKFLKLILTDSFDLPQKTKFLLFEHPNAFRLLTIIAQRARRIPDQPDGLEIGDAQIGDWEKCGFTRQEYRTALDLLIKQKIVLFKESNRTRQNSTTGSTTKGTLVKIIDLGVYDINITCQNHSNNHCPTTAQPLPNHEHRYNKRDKREEDITPLTPQDPKPIEKEKKISKIKFRDHVSLSQTEYDKLVSINGNAKVEGMLDILESYLGATGKKYKSDYHTMCNGGWVCKRYDEDLAKGKISTNKPQYNPNDRRVIGMDGNPIENQLAKAF